MKSIDREMTTNHYNKLNSELWNNLDYDYESSKKTIIPWINNMISNKTLGKCIMDIGCGAKPISNSIEEVSKSILVDIGIENKKTNNKLFICYDINYLKDPTNEETINFFNSIKSFLGDKDKVDTIILSNILNYIDYKVIVIKLNSIIDINSRIVILNRPFKGSYNLVSNAGVSDNFELLNTIEAANFIIEEINAWPNSCNVKEKNGIFPRGINYLKTSLILIQAKYIGEKRYLIRSDMFSSECGKFKLLDKYNFSFGYFINEDIIHNFISDILYKEFTHYEFSQKCYSYFESDTSGKTAQILIDYFDNLILKNKIRCISSNKEMTDNQEYINNKLDFDL